MVRRRKKEKESQSKRREKQHYGKKLKHAVHDLESTHTNTTPAKGKHYKPGSIIN